MGIVPSVPRQRFERPGFSLGAATAILPGIARRRVAACRVRFAVRSAVLAAAFVTEANPPMRWFHRPIALSALLVLSGCIGDLPRAEYPCLIATDVYDKYNESWVFSPRGDKKREALKRAREAERRCAAAAAGRES